MADVKLPRTPPLPTLPQPVSKSSDGRLKARATRAIARGVEKKGSFVLYDGCLYGANDNYDCIYMSACVSLNNAW